MRRILASLGPALVAISLASCSSDNNGPDVKTIQVTPTPVTLAQLQTSQLSVSVLNGTGQLITGVAVTFQSANADIATVSNTGLVTAGRAGSTSIHVRTDGASTDVPVSVTAVSNAIVMSPSPATVAQDGTLQVTAVVMDLSGQPIAGAPVTYSSGSPLLATVSAGGLVTPVGPAGQVSINAQSGTLTGSLSITITPVATSLTVAPNPITILKTASLQVSAQVRDRAGAPMPAIPITYTSSNTTLATVSNTGVLQGKGSLGTLNLVVTGAGFTTTVPVTLAEVGSIQGILDGTSPVANGAYGIDISPSGVIMVSGFGISQATLTNRTFALIGTNTQFDFAPAIATSGASVWVAGGGGIFEVDIATGAVLGTVANGGYVDYYVLRFSSDRSQLYASYNGGLLVIDPATRAVVRNIPLATQGLTLALNPASTTVYVGGQGPIYEVVPSSGTSRLVTSDPNSNFALSPDGQRLYLVVEGSPGLEVVKTSDGSVLQNFPVACGAWGIGISPDGTSVLETCANQVFVVVAATGTVQAQLDVGGYARRIGFSVDGRTAVVTNDNGNVAFIK